MRVIKYRNNPLQLNEWVEVVRIRKKERKKERTKERKKERIQGVGGTGLVSIIGNVSTDTCTILTWISLVKRPLSRPKWTQKDNIMRDIMELILYCASFISHDVEMLGG
jgi:hypothetical protein